MTLLACSCGGDGDDDRDRPPTVDESAGTYRGVGIGSSRAEAERVLGRSRSGLDEPLAPLGRRPLESGIPLSPKEPPGLDEVLLWRFRNAVMLGDRGKAWLVAVTAEDAHTKRGVGVGSSLEDVRQAYPSPHCARANEGTEYVQFDYCQVRIRPGRYAAFGDDPVESVTLSRAPLACPGEDDDVTGCPPPK